MSVEMEQNADLCEKVSSFLNIDIDINSIIVCLRQWCNQSHINHELLAECTYVAALDPV